MAARTADNHTELLDVVDAHNRKVSTAKRRAIHEQGLLHRAVHVIVSDEQHRVLLQQRSARKSLAPLGWDLSCAEHLSCDEDYLPAAVRGLHEELGLRVDAAQLQLLYDVRLQQLVYEKVGMKDNEFVCCYGAVLKGDQLNNVRFDPIEVEAVKMMPLEELLVDIQERSDAYTPWFVAMLQNGTLCFADDQLAYAIR